jgi:hypothetical protein
MNNEQQQEKLMYYVLMTDFNGKIYVMGKHDIEDDAVEHEAQLCKAHPNNHVWTCVESGALG